MSVFIKLALVYSSYDTHHGSLSVCGFDREAQGQMLADRCQYELISERVRGRLELLEE